LSVRGIGVAERVRTSTCRLISLMCSLCETEPLLLIDDEKPQVFEFHILLQERWVPMTRSHFPVFRSPSVRRVSAGVLKRDRTAMATGNPKNRWTAVW
jgi:hypothetical protein